MVSMGYSAVQGKDVASAASGCQGWCSRKPLVGRGCRSTTLWWTTVWLTTLAAQEHHGSTSRDAIYFRCGQEISPASTAQPDTAPAARLPTATLHAGALMGTADVLLSDAEAIMKSGTGAEAVGPGMCKDGSDSSAHWQHVWTRHARFCMHGCGPSPATRLPEAVCTTAGEEDMLMDAKAGCCRRRERRAEVEEADCCCARGPRHCACPAKLATSLSKPNCRPAAEFAISNGA